MPEALRSGKPHASAAVMLSLRAAGIFPQNGMVSENSLKTSSRRTPANAGTTMAVI
jgi:hypothetical protein